MKRAPLRCPVCRGLSVRVIDVEPDNDGRLATVWRQRWCEDCGHVQATAEVRVDRREALTRLAELARGRRTFA